MSRFSMLFFGAAMLLPGAAYGAAKPADSCMAKARTQFDMDECATHAWETADARLNALYRTLMANSDTAAKTLLRTAQRNWIAFRDSECAFETADSSGGSIAPMLQSECAAAKTNARIKELEIQRDCPQETSNCYAAP